jgi:hypothetical protein
MTALNGSLFDRVMRYMERQNNPIKRPKAKKYLQLICDWLEWDVKEEKPRETVWSEDLAELSGESETNARCYLKLFCKMGILEGVTIKGKLRARRKVYRLVDASRFK